jgi:hypothetical protein
MWIFQITQTLKTLCCVCLAAALSLFCTAFFRFDLPQGEGDEYYLYSPSSQAQIVPSFGWEDAPFLQGVSREYVALDGENFFAELVKDYHAKVWFEEEICGVKSYYCYSPRLGKCCRVGGYPVNLHVAIKAGGGGRAAIKVGSPLIFGGF